MIPFIRLANCPRGKYFKVKGDLILISSDIEQSLSKILPVQQSLIPVCFKRKLSYTGSYIEEYIEKEKIKLYFSWLKRNNHLFKDVDLDTSLIDNFENESNTTSTEIETKSADNISEEENIESDILRDFFGQETPEPQEMSE